MNIRTISINSKIFTGYVWTEPTTIDEAWEIIKQERTLRQREGGYKVGEKWFHSDKDSRIQQIGLVLLGVNIPETLMWKTMDNTFIQMTPTLAGQVFQAAAVSDATIFQIAEMKRAALTEENLSTFDPTTGWIQAYWEI